MIHGMKDTARDPSADFMEASDHADNVALNRNDAQIKSYDGKAGARICDRLFGA